MCPFPSNSLKSSNQAASALVAELALQPALQLLGPKIFDAVESLSKFAWQVGRTTTAEHFRSYAIRYKGDSHQSLTTQSLITQLISHWAWTRLNDAQLSI
jgi:hypothetical protein